MGTKKPTKGEWIAKAAEFASKHLKPKDYEAAWIANPQGNANVLKHTLPHFVLIPAVRDAADESKITKTSPFGRLIYEIVKNMDATLRDDLGSKLRETTRLLNREGKHERAAGVADVESTIKSFLGKLMPADLELEFQAPTVYRTTPAVDTRSMAARPVGE